MVENIYHNEAAVSIAIGVILLYGLITIGTTIYIASKYHLDEAAILGFAWPILLVDAIEDMLINLLKRIFRKV